MNEFLKNLPLTRLTPEHAALMAELEDICFDEPWSAAQCRGALAQPACAAFGLISSHPLPDAGKAACGPRGAICPIRLLGYISLYAVVDEMEVLNLAVLPEFRRQGLGARLLSLALQAGRKMGIEKVRLEARESNRAAISLYARFGFKPLGRRDRYYANGEAALVMALDMAN